MTNSCYNEAKTHGGEHERCQVQRPGNRIRDCIPRHVHAARRCLPTSGISSHICARSPPAETQITAGNDGPINNPQGLATTSPQANASAFHTRHRETTCRGRWRTRDRSGRWRIAVATEIGNQLGEKGPALSCHPTHRSGRSTHRAEGINDRR